MTDAEKVALANKMCKEYWDYYEYEEPANDARVFLACVSIVLEYGGAGNGCV